MEMARPISTPLNFSWRTLLLVAAVGNLLVLASLIVSIRDLLSLALALIILFGLALLRFRGGLLGFIVLALVFADIAAYTLTGAINNIIYREALLDLLIPASLATLSLAGLVAAIVAGVRRRQPEVAHGDGDAALSVGFGALALFLVLLMAGLTAPGGQRVEQHVAVETDLALQTEDMTFSDTALVATPGEVTVYLANHDLFWHTFTIDELGVNLQVPVRGEREITFTAAPGTYSFYCAIPGHALIGMRGTLTVK
ncbi:MAG: cupredoxin domain-containing protein [Anaerolineales bacterium]